LDIVNNKKIINNFGERFISIFDEYNQHLEEVNISYKKLLGIFNHLDTIGHAVISQIDNYEYLEKNIKDKLSENKKESKLYEDTKVKGLALLQNILDYLKIDCDLKKLRENIVMGNGLMWEEGSREMNWHQAMNYANNLRLGGYDDWRLPTIDELKEVVRSCGGTPMRYGNKDYSSIWAENRANIPYQNCLEKKGFTNFRYWSSTTNANYREDAWDVYLGSGSVGSYYKNNSGYVRCVRTGEQ